MTPPTPQDEGSQSACRVLRAMHRHPEGITNAGLATITGLDLYTVRDALTGLADRGRAASQCRGGLILWRTAQHHAQALQAAA